MLQLNGPRMLAQLKQGLRDFSKTKGYCCFRVIIFTDTANLIREEDMAEQCATTEYAPGQVHLRT